MTILHAIVECFSNDMETCDTVLEIYLSLEDAEYRILELDDVATGDESYYIKEYKLK